MIRKNIVIVSDVLANVFPLCFVSFCKNTNERRGLRPEFFRNNGLGGNCLLHFEKRHYLCIFDVNLDGFSL